MFHNCVFVRNAFCSSCTESITNLNHNTIQEEIYVTKYLKKNFFLSFQMISLLCLKIRSLIFLYKFTSIF